MAERGLYCLPTGRRFELAGQLDDILSELVQIPIAARRQSNQLPDSATRCGRRRYADSCRVASSGDLLTGGCGCNRPGSRPIPMNES